ncbi:hypothetical protein TNCV_575301 [Trichonephila clavipes]|nr:hypothetical protein TNCV_575301 [Trichonephila clavipes]
MAVKQRDCWPKDSPRGLLVEKLVKPRHTQSTGPRNLSWQEARCTLVVGSSLEQHASDRVRFLARFHPKFKEENPGEGSGASHISSSSTNFTIGLECYLEYPHAVKALCIYKHPYLLRDSNPGPYATAVNVANHYTGWATLNNCSKV